MQLLGSAGYNDVAQRQQRPLLIRPGVDAHVKDEILDPEKLSKALVGLRLKSRITITRPVRDTGAGIKCVIALGYSEAVQSQHLPWSGGSCTDQRVACSRGLCQVLKHRRWGTRYSATRKVTDVHLHSPARSSYFSSPLDTAVSP